MPSSLGVNLRVTGHASRGGRKYMEDFFSVAYMQSADEKDLEYAFFGIFDGHGGKNAAQFAKDHLMNSIVNQKLFWSENDNDVLRAIRVGYLNTHYEMWRELDKWPKTATGLPSTAGTTATIAFIRHSKIYIGHVGDSGIALGYQNEEGGEWHSELLTKDHKPECDDELARITNSGGKVVKKSGIPRVVWNRPKIGHKGPVRRSTQIDEIPFLAVARSLGDLWSYNSELNEFVVSPEPDVRVIEINPKTFRCLIFGTDGLWNVMRPEVAVNTVKMAERSNEVDLSYGLVKEWRNPSKSLVDEALNRWSIYRARADNTSVVTIMLDPPGPPKRDVLKATAANNDYSSDLPQQSYLEDASPIHRQMNGLEQQMEQDKNNVIYQQHQQQILQNNDMSHIDHMPLPTNGIALMTRFEDEDSSDTNHYDLTSSTTTHQQSENIMYMSSFAESYNSLLNSNMGYNHSESSSASCSTSGALANPSTSYNLNDSMDAEYLHYPDNTYSITNLESKMTHNNSTSATPMSYNDIEENYNMERYNYLDYSHVASLEEHDYVFPMHQPQTLSVENCTYNMQAKKPQQQVEECINSEMSEDDAIIEKEETIQINIISSSFNEGNGGAPCPPHSEDNIEDNLTMSRKVKKQPIKSPANKGSSTSPRNNKVQNDTNFLINHLDKKIGLRSKRSCSNSNLIVKRNISDNRSKINNKINIKSSENSTKKIKNTALMIINKDLMQGATPKAIMTRANTADSINNKNSQLSVMDITLRALRSRNTISSTVVSTTTPPVGKKLTTIRQPKINNTVEKAKKTIARIIARVPTPKSNSGLRKSSAGATSNVNQLSLLNNKSKLILRTKTKSNAIDLNKKLLKKRLCSRNNIWSAAIQTRTRMQQPVISGH